MLTSRMLVAVALAVVTIASPAAQPPADERRSEPRTRTPAEPAIIQLTGMVEPVRSRLVTAPRMTGGAQPNAQLVIVRMARAGTIVRNGDLLVEFDRTAALKNARDREAEYRDILAQIDKKQAEQLTARASRQMGLKLAENAVRRAELGLVGIELLPKITAEKNQQALEEAAAKLAQLRKTSDLHEQVAAADLRILELQCDRAKNAWDHAAGNADRMRIVSSIEGLVVLRSVFKAGTMAEMQEGGKKCGQACRSSKSWTRPACACGRPSTRPTWRRWRPG